MNPGQRTRMGGQWVHVLSRTKGWQRSKAFIAVRDFPCGECGSTIKQGEECLRTVHDFAGPCCTQMHPLLTYTDRAVQGCALCVVESKWRTRRCPHCSGTGRIPLTHDETPLDGEMSA